MPSRSVRTAVRTILGASRWSAKEDCVFCRIVHLDPHHEIIWQSRHSVVIRPFDPVAEGHLLVIPRVHVRDAFECPRITGYTMRDAAVYANIAHIGECNVITSVGRAATQTVFHLHAHLVPRVSADGLALPWTQRL